MNAVLRRLRRIRNLANKALVQVQNDLLRNSWVLGRPFQLTLEPGNVCNLKCPLCPTPTREERLPRGLLRLEDARTILDRFPYTVQLVLSNWGEPFLNKDIFGVIAYAKSRDVHVRVESNLTLFDDWKARRLVESGLDTLVVALDGASQDTYERYRRGGRFDVVVENVQRLRRIQDELGDQRTTIVWKFVVHRHNEHELDRARSRARELGMEFEAVTIWAPEGADEWRPRSTDGDGARNDGGEPAKCHNLWQAVSVNFNGDVFPCCSEFSPADRLANVLEQPFAPVWNGADYRRRRRANRGPVDCGTCHVDEDTQWYRTWMAPPDVAAGGEDVDAA